MGASIWNQGSVPILDPEDSIEVQRFVATEGQQLFVITAFEYALASNALAVFKNGLALAQTTDYTETSTTSFTLVLAAEAGDIIYVIGFKQVSNTTPEAVAAAAAALASQIAAEASEVAAGVSETNAAASEVASAISAAAALASETAASASETAAELAATNAATSESNALVSENNALASENAAAASALVASDAETVVVTNFNDFDTRYLGAKASDPALNNQGNPIADGALYFNTTDNAMKVYDLGTTSWLLAYVPVTGLLAAVNNLSDVADAEESRANLGLEIGADVQAYDADLTTWAGKTAPSGTVVGTTDTQTLTNKRINSRVQSVADAATVTPNSDTDDAVEVTALAQAVTFAAPTGTPVNFQKLIIRIKDNGTARALTWNAAYVAGGISLPAITTLSKILTLGFIYNTANALNKWQLVAYVVEA